MGSGSALVPSPCGCFRALRLKAWEEAISYHSRLTRPLPRYVCHPSPFPLISSPQTRDSNESACLLQCFNHRIRRCLPSTIGESPSSSFVAFFSYLQRSLLQAVCGPGGTRELPWLPTTILLLLLWYEQMSARVSSGFGLTSTSFLSMEMGSQR